MPKYGNDGAVVRGLADFYRVGKLGRESSITSTIVYKTLEMRNKDCEIEEISMIFVNAEKIKIVSFSAKRLSKSVK